MARRRISTRARANLFAAKGGICHFCGGKVQAGQAWDVSHVIPLAIGGDDEEHNWDVAHRKCHRDYTAAVDQPRIAKTKRQAAGHIGSRLRGRGFPKSAPQRTASRPLARREISHDH
jgi:5-methylcytosine-specific restriction protein A